MVTKHRNVSRMAKGLSLPCQKLQLSCSPLPQTFALKILHRTYSFVERNPAGISNRPSGCI